MSMLPHERCDFSAIVDRPPLKLPGGARIVVWTIVNYEVWDNARPMPRQVLPAPTGQALLPDVPNWTWHEYGMRVGAWRFFELFARRGLRPTLAINARVCEDYPRVAEEAKLANWEFMGHGYDQVPMHLLADQAATIGRCVDILERFCGYRPLGWLGPGLTQTLETPDLLARAGIKYIGDFVYDDERGAHHAALFGRAQRHPDDGRAAPPERLSLAPRHRSIRAPLRRERHAGQDHGHRHPSLYQRRAAPDQISRGDLRPRRKVRRRAALERRRNSRLVQVSDGGR
jgi:peptidoglycan/xylan/chitin deacetylase (PgdA/CDA1 family)